MIGFNSQNKSAKKLYIAQKFRFVRYYSSGIRIVILSDAPFFAILKVALVFFIFILENSQRMLRNLSNQLAVSSTTDDQHAILDSLNSVGEFFKVHPYLPVLLSELGPKYEIAFKQIVAIGQAKRLFSGVNEENLNVEKLSSLLEKLVAIDHFYREIGGITGYQAKVLQLLRGSSVGESNVNYHAPSFVDMTKESPDVTQSVEWGIDTLDQMAEIYPLGGAADRLHLVEEGSGQELPAAKLAFAKITLLEHLIRDLQAREYLYFQKYGVQLITPIAIMTSYEKNNHAHIQQICENANYFGRPPDSIRFFTQPLVPAVGENGDWCIAGPLSPVFKPGGHGAIWKLARDEGIFSWLKGLGRTKALIRQINNPIAGLDYGLLAFSGMGCKGEMKFGFASCPRLLKAAEGVNVLVEKEDQIVLTNIEYCDFKKFGIKDLPLVEGEPYSRFSSNTNILFADLDAVSEAIDTCPFPGLLLNLKNGTYRTDSGEKKQMPMARLESTMQNIADVFVEKKGAQLKTERTYVTYNLRHKTISTAKKAYVEGGALQETPENCFYDLLFAHRELLLACGFQLPPQRTLEEYMEKGPEFLLLYHPSLGPLYSKIREKLIEGTLHQGSELLLEIADLKISKLVLKGSLQIKAEQVMGRRDNQGVLQYSQKVGKCILENVRIENAGVDWSSSKPFWKTNVKRNETVQIILKGQSTFIARNVHLKGSYTYVVEDGQVMEI
ncbi:MAG: hypothetical protein COT85_07530 [Chlamydiae bacterium CG10_big_fil_rev_8_21_14_0_10_42_34]|nr:MAG: hypothetical protein COT85_07530 [Chlamydiae bacterium CG10_big_fil_rev_8_21_14_0_10_42_34]